MNREHYTARHTGELGHSDIKHVPAKPWAVIRVAEDGQMTLVSRHAEEATARGIVVRSNRKLGIVPKPSDDELREAVDAARRQLPAVVVSIEPALTPEEKTKAAAEKAKADADWQDWIKVELPAYKKALAALTLRITQRQFERRYPGLAALEAAHPKKLLSTLDKVVAETRKRYSYRGVQWDRWTAYLRDLDIPRALRKRPAKRKPAVKQPVKRKPTTRQLVKAIVKRMEHPGDRIDRPARRKRMR